MKKIIFLILALLTFLMPNIVKASTNDSIIDYSLDTSIYYHRIKDGVQKNGNLAIITANNKIGYCLEPGILAEKNGIYSSTYNIEDTYISKDKYKMLSLIGYYGYTYEGHNTKEYYMAAQELIWRYLGVSDTWWTDYNGNYYNIDNYKNEILSLVNSYEKFPELNLKEKYTIGSTISIEDNLLQNYILDKQYDNIKLSNNKLEITIKEENNFILKRKTNDKKIIFYYKAGYQTIGTFEGIFDSEKIYSTKGEYSNIELEKKDIDNKVYNNTSLKDAKYGLYDENDNLILTNKTNEEGKLLFENIPYGKYYIKEIIPSLGYTLDNNKYEVIISFDTFKVQVISYEKVITNDILITKVYDDGTSDILEKEENIEFGLYDENDNLINTYKTDANGSINLNLSYGTYILKQLTKQDGIIMVNPVKIDVIEDGKINKMVLVNKKEKKLPNTGKSINYIYLILSNLLSISLKIYEKIHI